MHQNNASACDPRAGFYVLPNELKVEIFKYISSVHDLREMQLVCREWNHLLRSITWREFKTSLSGSLATNIHKLVEEQHACFHKIRTLAVGRRRWMSNYDTHFSALMDILHQNQLHSFTSGYEVPLSSTQLISVLNHQPSLQSFRARLDLSDIVDKQRNSWIEQHTPLFTSSLSSLRLLRIYVGNLNPRSWISYKAPPVQDLEMAFNRFLIKNTPSLQKLEISGRQPLRDVDNSTSFLGLLFRRRSGNLVAAPRTLEHLVLSDLNLFALQHLEKMIDFASLTSLRLEFCARLWTFLSELTHSFRRTKPRLTTLSVRAGRREPRSHEENNQTLRALEDLLCSFADLETLEIEIDPWFLINFKECTRTHQTTLKKLLVSCTRMDFDWHPIHFAPIFEALPNLHSFAFSLPNSRSFNIDSRVVEVEALPWWVDWLNPRLDTIAGVKSLRTLCLVYAPDFSNLDFNREIDASAEDGSKLTGRLATAILKRLREKGSNITSLSMAPSSRWEDSARENNTYCYPFYFYKLQVAVVDGESSAEAVLAREYWPYYPDTTTSAYGFGWEHVL